ncbi:MAG: CNNM domain-containing protein [candidate division WOR-3 bacterium]
MGFFFGILAIFFQGLFSGSETAVMRVNWLRILLKGKKKLFLLQNREQTILTSLIGTNLSVVLASFAFSYFFVATLGEGFIILSVIWVTILSLIFGEFLPKAIAKEYPEFWYEYLYSFLIFANRFFSPFTRFLQKIIQPLLKEKRKELKLTKEDLLSLFGKEGHEKIARAVLEFSSLKAKDVMIPLKFTIAINKEASLPAIYHILKEYGYSRYPIYEKKKGNVIGILHAKDFLFYPDLKIRPPYFVSDDKKLKDVFSEMRRGKDKGIHLAIVLNRAGKAIGILTLEDILEEIVGEIRSEF